MGSKMRGTIIKRMRSADAGYFFVRGDDGKEYYAARKFCKNYVRKHWNQFVQVGKVVYFIPKKSDRERPNATEIDFEDDRHDNKRVGN